MMNFTSLKAAAIPVAIALSTAKSRAMPSAPKPTSPKMKPVPEAAVASVGETLREEGLPATLKNIASAPEYGGFAV